MNQAMSGLRAWMVQRISAVYMALFGAYLVVHLGWFPPASYRAWQVWMSGTWVEIGTLLFFLALSLHAWVGVRDVVLDYVSAAGNRLLVLALVVTGLVAQMLWLMKILLGAGS